MLLSQISKQTAFELHGLLENKCLLAHLARGDFMQRRGVFSLGGASVFTVSFFLSSCLSRSSRPRRGAATPRYPGPAGHHGTPARSEPPALLIPSLPCPGTWLGSHTWRLTCTLDPRTPPAVSSCGSCPSHPPSHPSRPWGCRQAGGALVVLGGDAVVGLSSISGHCSVLRESLGWGIVTAELSPVSLPVPAPCSPVPPWRSCTPLAFQRSWTATRSLWRLQSPWTSPASVLSWRKLMLCRAMK